MNRASIAAFVREIVPQWEEKYLDRLLHTFHERMDASMGDSFCWPWLGADNLRYGVLGISLKIDGKWKTRLIYAHRVAVVISGRELTRDQEACHHCDWPRCVNPHHLFVGDRSANVRDAIAKGRHRGWVAGDGHVPPLTKLDVEQVRVIRATLAEGRFTQAEIARHFGMSENQIQRINARRAWRESA